MCKVTRYSSIERCGMCPDNKGQFILYKDYKKVIELVAISLMNIRNEESDYIVNVIDDLNEKIGKLL